jgi:hypothetical protein
MARKPPPKHALSTRQRRVGPRHAAQREPLLPPDSVQVGPIASLAVTVAGAAVMAGSAYSYGEPQPYQPSETVNSRPYQDTLNQPSTEVAGATQRAGEEQAAVPQGTSPALDGPVSLQSLGRGPSSSLEEERNGRPAFVSISSIGTASSLIELGLDADGKLEVPIDFGQAGWWKGGPRPGDPGPAVITGHLDSTRGPAVFAKLRKVKPGDEIVVARNDGVRLVFVVTRIDSYPKRAFPTRTVYGPTDAAELRVITCGGSFDRSKGSYDDNTVVFAKLYEPPAPATGATTGR